MKKLIKILKNSNKIIEGIKNSVLRDQFVEEVYKRRMAICTVCPNFDTEGEDCAMPGTQPCCSACGCKLSWKARSLGSQCGDDDNIRWPAIMKPEEEEALIKKFGEPKEPKNV